MIIKKFLRFVLQSIRMSRKNINFGVKKIQKSNFLQKRESI